MSEPVDPVPQWVEDGWALCLTYLEEDHGVARIAQLARRALLSRLVMNQTLRDLREQVRQLERENYELRQR